MSTDETNEDTSIVITAVDGIPPVTETDSHQPIVDDDPMPNPYEDIRHIKNFFESAAGPLIGSLVVVPAIVVVGFVDGILLQSLIFVLWLIAMTYLTFMTLRFWKEWRERPISIPDPRSCTMYVDQRGVAWLYPFGMRDSPPDPWRLPAYEPITPPRTFLEMVVFKNCKTLWLVQEGEGDDGPPPDRRFKNIKNVEAIIKIWEWNRRQVIVQQDEVIELLQEVRNETIKNGVMLSEIRDALLDLVSLMRP